MIWACGWWVSADPQVWSTAVSPMRAPRCLGSWAFSPRTCPVGAMVSSVSAAVRNQQVIDDSLVLIGDWRDLGGQCEDHVEIADRQQIGFAGRKPILRPHGSSPWAEGPRVKPVG